MGRNIKYTTDEYVKIVDKTQPLYNHSKVNYIDGKTKIKVECPIHGYWLVNPLNYKNKKTGCPKCVIRHPMQNTKELIEDFVKTHKDRYDYSKVISKGSTNKVTIICKSHGEFNQVAITHKLGSGCPKCSNIKSEEEKELYNKRFYDKLMKFDTKTTLDYSKFKYSTYHTDGIVICDYHGEFKQTPKSIFSGYGCIKCATITKNRRYPKGETMLYYLRINDKFFKIGITSDLKKRFDKDIKNGVKIELLKYKIFDTGQEAHQMESKILFENSKDSYNGTAILISGNTELFQKDIQQNFIGLL